MRLLVAGFRLGIALAVVVAVGATLATAVRPVRVLDFFGFFTIQSNLIAGAVAATAAVAVLRRRTAPPLLRAAGTTYIALTGLVYNTLLTDVAGGVALPWANTVLHTIVPVAVLADWALVADRPPLPWSRLWVIVPYPLVWVVVVLIRGATDGWVPYPFLDPVLGYGVVAAYSVGIAVAVLAIGAVVWALSRLRPVRLRSVRPRPVRP